MSSYRRGDQSLTKRKMNQNIDVYVYTVYMPLPERKMNQAIDYVYIHTHIYTYESKMNVVARAQLTFQMLTYIYNIYIYIYGRMYILKRTVCHAQDLRTLARSCKQLCWLCPSDPWNLPDTALPCGFKAQWELWNPTSKIVHNKCGFIWNEKHVNIWNDRKAQKYLVKQLYFELLV